MGAAGVGGGVAQAEAETEKESREESGEAGENGVRVNFPSANSA